MRARLFDLFFLWGVFAKAVDGLIEVVGGIVLLWLPPEQFAALVRGVTAGEVDEDPHDLIANLLLRGIAHLYVATTAFVSAYLLLHGLVKLAIVAALAWGSLRIYPWAIAALCAFLAFQLYEMLVHPTLGVAVLTLLDALIIWLTWREWRRGSTMRDALARSSWIVRRHRR